ncbi:MAG TPA: alpha/beta hydrolase [Luteitalea sp.]|nr:alpha/beta hydrolase [Luteitalea sp.]
MATTRRRFLVWSALGALVAIVLAYASAVGYMMANEVSFIFAPNARAYDVAPEVATRIERIQRTTSGGTPALLWAMRQDALDAPWIIFLHGNAANVSTPGNVTRYLQLHSLGVQVVAPEYLGFGALGGVASEDGAAAAARDAWEWLRAQGIPASRIGIYGWSLGSGVAVRLASTVDERALILEGAFTGVDDRAREVYPWLPVSSIIRNPFATRDRIGVTGSPLLLLHAEDDEVIPFAHGQRLLALAKAPKRLVVLRGGHIRPNVADQATYMAGLREFVREYLPQPVPTVVAPTSPGHSARRAPARR